MNERYEKLAKIISDSLLEGNSLMINIQVPEESTQYDIWFSYKLENYGSHQRGIIPSDLLIGIFGFKCFGFRTDISDTHPNYYEEKLGVYSEILSEMFNRIRTSIKEKVYGK